MRAGGRVIYRPANCNINLTATGMAPAGQMAAGAGRLGRGADLGLPRNAGSHHANEQLPEPRRDRAAPRSRRPTADEPRAATLRM
jgi:hypothetical protein